jgi:hypothetical protein
MHFHLPKPLHGWREFAGEVAIIVLGVLIALGLEQLVERWHWHDRVQHAVAALSLELSETIGQGQERLNVAPCVDRRLDELSSIIDHASLSGRLPPLGRFGVPPVRTYSTGVWQSTLAGQTAEHLTDGDRGIYSVIYGFSEILSTINRDELAEWTRLATISGPGRSLDATDADALRLALSQARTDNQAMLHYSIRIRQAVANFDLSFDHQFASSFNQPLSAYSICQPISPPLLHYGASPIVDAIGNATRHKSLKAQVGSPMGGAAL